ncbi:MAG: (4Fe-4S)-binding protein [Ferruginibacter sp.]
MPLNTHKYTREGVTVVWQPEKCIHSGICAKGLPQVFNPRRKPWIDMSVAEIDAIKNQVNLCPSGALSLQEESAETNEGD